MGSSLWLLVEALLGVRRAGEAFGPVWVPPALLPSGGTVSRGQLAFALALLLLRDFQDRVPSAGTYLLDVVAEGERMRFDHAEVRTVLAPAGSLPPGAACLARVLGPLGYAPVEAHAPRFAMTGTVHRHRDLPGDLPQFLVGEFHPGGFSGPFREAAARVLASAREPLPPQALAHLAELGSAGSLPMERALRLLPNLVACFKRTHDPPSLADYRVLSQESPELAWIATEGQSLRFAADRVADADGRVLRQLALGRALQDGMEVSAGGGVRRASFQADPVERPFRDLEGHMVLKTVPGSSFGFVTRGPGPGGLPDLTLDLTLEVGPGPGPGPSIFRAHLGSRGLLG